MPTRNPAVLPCVPRPIQVLVVEQLDLSGGVTAVIRRWPTVQARACRLCDVCTFVPGDDDQGICVLAVRAEVDLERAALLGVLGGRVVYGGQGGADRG